MENLRQKFLDEAVSSLENICSKLSAESFDENFSREIFRAFHTLKGTSQTFNFNAAGKLAHELENLLQAAKDRKIQPDKNFTALLLEGAEILRATFSRATARKIVFRTNSSKNFALRFRIIPPRFPKIFLTTFRRKF